MKRSPENNVFRAVLFYRAVRRRKNCTERANGNPKDVPKAYDGTLRGDICA